MRNSRSCSSLPHTVSRVLRCNPSAILFHASQNHPEITCPETAQALQIAAHHLTDSLQPIAISTETVYGLAAVALNTDAVSRIFSVKQRPIDNPLIVHVSSFEMLDSLLPKTFVWPLAYRTLTERFWPGPLTLLFPRDESIVPAIITAGQSTVAIRMPSHSIARALIAISDTPLAAPSANSSGKPSPTRAEHVLDDLGKRIDIILDGGPCNVGVESTVVDGLHPDGNIRVLRPGGVTVEAMEQALGEDIHFTPKVLVHRRDFEDKEIELTPTTPGMKYRHYSPSVPLILLLTLSQTPEHKKRTSLTSFLESLKIAGRRKIGILAPIDSKIWSALCSSDSFQSFPYPLGYKCDPAVTAQRLFNGFLSLERQGVDIMLIEEIEEDKEGLAVMNRVRKAASGIQWITCELEESRSPYKMIPSRLLLSSCDQE